MVFQAFSGYQPIVLFSTKIVSGTNKAAARITTVAVGVTNLLAVAGSSVIVDRISVCPPHLGLGRRIIILVGCVGMVITHVLTGLGLFWEVEAVAAYVR